MIKLFFLALFLFVSACPVRADDSAADDQAFAAQVENLKNPFDNGIPKPVAPVVAPAVSTVPKPVFHEKPKWTPPPRPKIVLPELQLQGVIVGEGMHQAIIDDQVVPLNGRIKGAAVISISKRGVNLLYQGKKFFLKVE